MELSEVKQVEIQGVHYIKLNYKELFINTLKPISGSEKD